VFPGTVLGALLIYAIEKGPTILNMDWFIYPLITSDVIFVAVLQDATRTRALAHLNGRKIFVETDSHTSGVRPKAADPG
jgi:ribose transport system permease protein